MGNPLIQGNLGLARYLVFPKSFGCLSLVNLQDGPSYIGDTEIHPHSCLFFPLSMLIFAGVVMNEVQYVLYAPKMAENEWVSLGLFHPTYGIFTLRFACLMLGKSFKKNNIFSYEWCFFHGDESHGAILKNHLQQIQA